MIYHLDLQELRVRRLWEIKIRYNLNNDLKLSSINVAGNAFGAQGARVLCAQLPEGVTHLDLSRTHVCTGEQPAVGIGALFLIVLLTRGLAGAHRAGPEHTRSEQSGHVQYRLPILAEHHMQRHAPVVSLGPNRQECAVLGA